MSILNISNNNKSLITNEPEDWNGYSLEELQKPYTTSKKISFSVKITNLRKENRFGHEDSYKYFYFTEKSVLTLSNINITLPHINYIYVGFMTRWQCQVATDSYKGNSVRAPFLLYIMIQNPYQTAGKGSTTDASWMRMGNTDKITVYYQTASNKSRSVILKPTTNYAADSYQNGINYAPNGPSAQRLDITSYKQVIAVYDREITAAKTINNDSLFCFRDTNLTKKPVSIIRIGDIGYYTNTLIPDFTENINYLSYTLNITFPTATYP